MPELKIHEENSIKKYGKPFTELHQWMDEPVLVFGKSHRRFRHDPDTTPQEAKRLFGENADHVCLDHIILDLLETQKRKKKKVMSDRRVTFRMEPEWIELIQQYAVLTGKDTSKIIRELLIEGLKKNAPYALYARFEEYLEKRDPFEQSNICEKCGKKENGLIYFIDGNVNNRNSNNLFVLCKECANKFEEFKKIRLSRSLKEKFIEWWFTQ